MFAGWLQAKQVPDTNIMLNASVIQNSALFPSPASSHIISPVKDYMNAEAGRFLLYVTEPALLPGSRTLEWRGRLPTNLPSSFEAHLTAVRHCIIVQLQVLTGTGTFHILSSTLPLRIIHHPLVSFLPLTTAILKEFTSPASPTDLALPTGVQELRNKLGDLKREWDMQKRDTDIQLQCTGLTEASGIVRMMRERIEASSQFSKSVALRSEGSEDPFAVVEVRRAHVMPGGKIIGHVKLCSGHTVESLRLSIETIEVLGEIALLNRDSDVHLVSLVRRQEWACRDLDRIDFIIGLPLTGIDGNFEMPLLSLQWVMRIALHTKLGEYEATLPLIVYSSLT